MLILFYEPFSCLLLWVDDKRPFFNVFHNDSILYEVVIFWGIIKTPLIDYLLSSEEINKSVVFSELKV